MPVNLAMDGYNVGRLLFSDSHGDNTILNVTPDNATTNTMTSTTAGHISGAGQTAGYTGDGLRVWKQTDAGARTYSPYDGSDPVAELDARGTLQATNTFGAQGLVSRHTVAANSSVFYTFDERGNVAPKQRKPPGLTLRSGGFLLSVSCLLLPKGGLEPPRGCPQRFLRPPRLPFRHFGNCR